MTGGVLNPPVFLYSADYEALTENTITISLAVQKTPRAAFLHKIVDLVDITKDPDIVYRGALAPRHPR
jgi:hypothetical protein